MSRHWKFEVHVSTLGESDDGDETVERFALHVRELAAMWTQSPGYQRADIEISVGDVERT